MNKLFLLPTGFKANGLTMIFLGLLGLSVASQEGLINVYRILAPGNAIADGSYPYPANFWQINAIFEYTSIALVAVGLLCFFMSRERDEFYYKVRLESIQFAILMQLCVGVVMYCFFYFSGNYQMENTFTAILSVSFAGFWIAHISRYYYMIRLRSNEDLTL
jgi:glucan phosphoethanolaminetransferase (alkaline phosphatase superfamily)